MSNTEAGKANPIVASNDPNCNPQLNEGDHVGTENPTQQNFNDLDGLLSQIKEFMDLVRLPPFHLTHGSLWLKVGGAYEGGGRHWAIQTSQYGPKLGQVDIDGSLFYTAQEARQEIVIRYFKEAIKQSLETGRLIHITGSCSDN
jgi:hypothetical protein